MASCVTQFCINISYPVLVQHVYTSYGWNNTKVGSLLLAD